MNDVSQCALPQVPKDDRCSGTTSSHTYYALHRYIFGNPREGFGIQSIYKTLITMLPVRRNISAARLVQIRSTQAFLVSAGFMHKNMQYSFMHPAQKRQLLREVLSVTRVITVSQLHKYGLSDVPGWLGLPSRVVTCKTRTTQRHSLVDLEFVALQDAWLNPGIPGQGLMHWAGLAELLLLEELKPGMRAELVLNPGRGAGRKPDMLIWMPGDGRADTAVEFDAGYSDKVVKQKLIAAASAGYRRMLWGCTVHGRLEKIARMADRLAHLGQLAGLSEVDLRFTDVWTPGNPYVNRPRCHKPMRATWSYGSGTVTS